MNQNIDELVNALRSVGRGDVTYPEDGWPYLVWNNVAVSYYVSNDTFKLHYPHKAPKWRQKHETFNRVEDVRKRLMELCKVK